MSDEATLVIALRAEDARHVTPGSFERECDGVCGKTLTVAPSSRPLLDRPGARAMCHPCAEREVAISTDSEHHMAVTEEQRREVARELGVPRHTSDAVIDALLEREGRKLGVERREGR